MNNTPNRSLPGIPPVKKQISCGWCDSTHVADTVCTCKEPCSQGWCPAREDMEIRYL